MKLKIGGPGVTALFRTFFWFAVMIQQLYNVYKRLHAIEDEEDLILLGICTLSSCVDIYWLTLTVIDNIRQQKRLASNEASSSIYEKDTWLVFVKLVLNSIQVLTSSVCKLTKVTLYLESLILSMGIMMVSVNLSYKIFRMTAQIEQKSK